METTAQQIFKRLTGQVANVGSAISSVKHGVEDMKKEAEKASASSSKSQNQQTQQVNTDAQMRDRALESAQNQIDNHAQQNADYQQRLQDLI